MCFTSTVNQSSSPNPQVLADYQQLINQAQNVGGSLSNLQGPPVAGLTGEQQAGTSTINSALGAASPYYNMGLSGLMGGYGTVSSGTGYLPAAAGTYGTALNYLPGAAGTIGAGANTLGSALPYYGTGAGLVGQSTVNPITSGQVSQYMSPYIGNVVNATEQQFNNQNAIQANQLTGSAIMGGNAFGGDRAGVAQGVLAGQQQTAEAPVIAGLYNTGYQNAAQQAMGEQSLLQSAGGLYGSLGAGVAGVGTGLGTLGTEYGNLANITGNLGAGIAGLGSISGQLGTEQAGIGSTTAGLGNNIGGLYLNTGSSQLGAGATAQSTEQAQLNSQYQQLLNSLGVTGLGFEAPIVEGTGSLTGGTSTTQSTPSIFSLLSDKRAKEDVKKIGKLFDGQSVYRFRYKGDPTTRIGLIAQNVEHENPDAIHEIGGLKTVDYDAATKEAARKKHFARGGIALDDGGSVDDIQSSSGLNPLIGYDALAAILGGGSRANQEGAGLLKLQGGGAAMGPLGGNIFGGPVTPMIPTIQGTHGSGPPKPPVPPQQGSGLISQGLKGIGAYNTLNKAGLFGGTPATGAPLNITPDIAVTGPVDTSAEMTTIGPGSASGGRIGYADGGTPDDSDTLSPTQTKIINEAQAQGIDPAWALRTANQESRANQYDAKGNIRTSPAGALGVMQLMPETAKDLGVDPYDEDQNIKGGIRYLKQMQDRYGDQGLASAAYNAGPRRVDSYLSDGTPLPAETMNYVPAVTNNSLGGLPPEITRGSSATPSTTQNAGIGGLRSFQPDIGQAVLSGIGGMFSGHGIIGGGIMGGLGNIAAQKEQAREDATVEQRAQQLAQTASHWQKQLDLQTKEFGQRQEQYQVPSGYRRTATGIEPTPGGPHDPATIEREAQAKGEMWSPVLTPEGSYVLMNKKTGEVKSSSQLGTQPQAPTSTAPKVQLASSDGIIPANTQLAQQPYAYHHDAPYIEKGMDVPEPTPVSNKSVQTLKTDAEYYLQTGKLPPVSRGNSPVAIQQNNYRNAVQNYANATAQSRGLSPEQTADMWRTAPGMLRFIMGPDGRSTVSLGTAVRHLDTLQQLADAWKSGDVQTINRVKAAISREFGSSAATNLESAAQIVGPEIIKAIGVAGAGTDKDRNDAAAQFSAIRSPEQISGAIQTVQRLLGGQLEGRQRQAMNAGVSPDRFKSLIGDRPYEILSHIDKVSATGNSPGAAVQVSSPEEARRLPSGTKIILPDGRQGTVP